MKRLLPAKPDELRGLRARRYVRVSSEDQGTKYGPDRQHEEVERAIARLGLEESGPAFVDEQSGYSRSEQRPALQDALAAAAAGEFDVLVVAYFSRWSRDAEIAHRTRRELHDAGVVLFFADEWFLSSDEDQLEQFVQEAASAQIFSIKLSRTIRKTLAAKFERHGDQAGSPGLGFMRTPQPEARLAIDPETMPRVVALFERYAMGDISYRELALESGVAEGALRAILTNPLYNGWARRHRRRPDETKVAAPWRSAPPVSDELWARVAEVRGRRVKVAGRARPVRPHLLAKLMVCTCGRGLAADTVSVPGRASHTRYRHEDCDRWSQQSHKAAVFEDPIAAQLSGIRLDQSTLARIRAIAGRPAPDGTDLRRAQLEAELRRKAGDHAARRITTEAYLAEHTRITAEIDGLTAIATPAITDADAVLGALRQFAKAWKDADPSGRAAVARRVYRRVTVEDRQIVEVELTEPAKALGLMYALPETVSVMGMARPARLGRAQTTTRRTVRIPIAGRRDWLRATRPA